MSNLNPEVAIVMGSDSDWPIMEAAALTLAEFKIAYEVELLSAHRMPEEMMAYGKSAASRGIKIIIAGAGGAAHLPGMLASISALPVIGVPIMLKALEGIDSLLSIAQMPAGIPVATVGIGNAKNAGLLAVRMLSVGNPDLVKAVENQMVKLNENVKIKAKALKIASQSPEAPSGQ
ncbi:MAG: 5-(carboxyamino)imidazole ribonucleotide mutase [Actinobacteria bacterium]|nr:5-(carboxyamino)imidazole ribonucleotide mutase [Actinomycetota bacterium]